MVKLESSRLNTSLFMNLPHTYSKNNNKKQKLIKQASLKPITIFICRNSLHALLFKVKINRGDLSDPRS